LRFLRFDRTSYPSHRTGFRISATLLSLLTVLPLADAVMHLDRMNADRAKASAVSWALPYGPPIWLHAIVIAASLAFGLFLVWRASDIAHARMLAVFILLLAATQAFLLNPEFWYRVGVDPLLPHMKAAWPRWLTRSYLRSFQFGVGVITWPLWFFAAAAFLSFAQQFPSGARARASNMSRFEAGWTVALITWLCIDALIWRGPIDYEDWSRIGLVLGIATAALALTPTRLLRQFALPARTRRMWLAISAIVLIATAVPHWSMRLLVVTVGCVLAWLRSNDLSALMPRWIWLVPCLFAVVHGFDMAPTWPSLLPWLGFAIVAGVRELHANLKRAAPVEQARVLWIYVGLVMAAGLPLMYAAIVIVNLFAQCTGPTHIACWLVSIQDWFLVLPLPLLSGFLAFAVLRQGALDPGLVLKRTTAFNIMAVLLIFLLGMFDFALSQVLQPLIPERMSKYIAAGVIALLLYPVRRVSERSAERFVRFVVGVPPASLEPAQSSPRPAG